MSVSKDTHGRLRALAVRNTEFYRPKVEDVPWSLIERGAPLLTDDALRSAVDLDYTRVACQIEPAETVGIYSMRRLDEQRFEIVSVGVLPEFEHQLIGRRLLGHALGLAESKAARVVQLAVCDGNDRALDMALRYGFERVTPAPEDADSGLIQLHFVLTPE